MEPSDLLRDEVVRLILTSRPGRRLLATGDDEMRRFLSSAEIALSVGAGDEASVAATVQQARSASRLDADVYLEGGLSTAVGLVGALTVLDERGYAVHTCGGAAGGALVAALLASGYSPADVRELLFRLDLRRLLVKRRRLPFAGAAEFALDPFRAWATELLAGKGVRAFGDLRTGSDEPTASHRLQVLVSDETGRSLALPRDAVALGLDPDRLEVAFAVAASLSTPGLFDPVRVENPATGGTHVLVDGTVSSPFPVWLFDVERPQRPTFGVATDDRASRLADDASRRRTIVVPSLGVQPFELDLPPARVLEIYDAGRGACAAFLQSWQLDAYANTLRGASV